MAMARVAIGLVAPGAGTHVLIGDRVRGRIGVRGRDRYRGKGEVKAHVTMGVGARVRGRVAMVVAVGADLHVVGSHCW